MLAVLQQEVSCKLKFGNDWVAVGTQFQIFSSNTLLHTPLRNMECGMAFQILLTLKPTKLLFDENGADKQADDGFGLMVMVSQE